MSEAIPGLPVPPPPRTRPAAAVILWRDGPEGREVFWVRRGEGLRFAGGFHAFPGGRVDDDDQRVPVPGLSGDEAAHVAAACRELFEEAGVLLAHGAERLQPSQRDEARHALLDGRVGFADLLFQEGLALDPALLSPAGRWVTPAFFPVRFDAWFYLARLAGRPGGLGVARGAHRRRVRPRPPRARVVGARRRAPPPAQLVGHRVDRARGAAGRARAAPPSARPTCSSSSSVAWSWPRCARPPCCPPPTPTAGSSTWSRAAAWRSSTPGSPEPAEQARLDWVLEILAAAGRPAREVWLTHHHVDHVGGVAPLAARGLRSGPTRSPPGACRGGSR